MKTVAFFNNKGGVGKTSLVYHLAWMFAEQGVSVLAVDLDPQANLTSLFLEEKRLEKLWAGAEHPETIYGALRPIIRGLGDVTTPHVEHFRENLGLIAGDLGLSRFEDRLADAWPRCHHRDEAAFRTVTAFHRAMELGAADEKELVLIDVGPNLGAINRAALIAADFVVTPLAPDLYSLQELQNLGPALREWQELWNELLPKATSDLSMPKGSMSAIGYVVMQHGIRDSRPVKVYQRWLDKIPSAYAHAVLNQNTSAVVGDDKNKLALLKHYRSLMPLAMEAHKPIFHLKPSDGAIGAHVEAVSNCYQDFLELAKAISLRIGIGAIS